MIYYKKPKPIEYEETYDPYTETILIWNRKTMIPEGIIYKEVTDEVEQ